MTSLRRVLPFCRRYGPGFFPYATVEWRHRPILGAWLTILSPADPGWPGRPRPHLWALSLADSLPHPTGLSGALP